jgi:hypothetical protein
MPVLTLDAQRLKLRRPLDSAWGRLRERELIRIRLTWPDGSWGDGEAAPLEPYDGVSAAAVRAALDSYGAVLAAAEPEATLPELLPRVPPSVTSAGAGGRRPGPVGPGRTAGRRAGGVAARSPARRAGSSSTRSSRHPTVPRPPPRPLAPPPRATSA